SDRGSKRQKEGGEHASASIPSETATRGTDRSTTRSQSQKLSASESAFAEEPVQTTCQIEEPPHPVFETGADDQPIVQTSQHPEWFSQPRRPPSSDRDWNKTLPAAQGDTQSWINGSSGTDLVSSLRTNLKRFLRNQSSQFSSNQSSMALRTMATTIEQQVALDEALNPSIKRLRIRRSNFRLPSDIQSKEPTLQVNYDVLRSCPFFKAFLVTTDVPKIYIQEFWATAYVHQHSIRFKLDNKKHIINLETFQDLFHMCLRFHVQSFDELPFEEEIMEFLWLSQAQILWRLYHSRNIDYAFLIWEDFMYQVEHKNQNKSNEMYYPGFTKVIIHHFMSKDLSIPRRNKVNWHYVRDDFIFSTIKVNGFDSSTTPPTAVSSLRPTIVVTPRLTATAKGKQPAKAKSPSDPSELARTEAQQLKIVLKRSRQETHISQHGGFGTDEGTDSEDDGNDKEDQGLRISEEERLTEEEEANELYRDVDINQGRGLPLSQDIEDSHVTLTPVNLDGQQTNPFAEAVSNISALVEAYEADKIILDTYGERVILKRRHDDDDDQGEGPSAGSDRGVDTLTPQLLAGPTYELMKGSCNSLTELEYHLKEVYKATTNQLDWVNPKGQQYPHNLLQPLPLIPDNIGRRVIPFAHFINNDLEYIWGGASSRKYTTSATKTKATDYENIKWIEDLVLRSMFVVNRESAIDVYSKRRIIAVTDLKIVEWHNYKHLDWISVHRDDDKIYKFKEGDFKRLRLQDIEDILLLLVQGKLFNLTVEERFAFNVSLKMFTRSIVIQRRMEDLQQGVESYHKRLNLTKPDTYRSNLKRREAYTAYSNPRGFIYQNKDKKNRLMRIDELYKFSDGTLNDVRNALDDRLKGIRMQYLPQTIWRKGDKDRAATMIQAIEKMLRTRRIMRSLE
nr:hypothetical protein [Tanacetum cinerariifolium]